jgi:hypothetical protein
MVNVSLFLGSVFSRRKIFRISLARVSFSIHWHTHNLAIHIHTYIQSHRQITAAIILSKAKKCCGGNRHRGPRSHWSPCRPFKLLINPLILLYVVHYPASSGNYRRAVLFGCRRALSCLTWIDLEKVDLKCNAFFRIHACKYSHKIDVAPTVRTRKQVNYYGSKFNRLHNPTTPLSA